jgi:hypothetical protein
MFRHKAERKLLKSRVVDEVGLPLQLLPLLQFNERWELHLMSKKHKRRASGAGTFYVNMWIKHD